MYWTNRGFAGPGGDAKIQRANLDGANIEDIMVLPIGARPEGIDLDLTAGKMYGVDNGSPHLIQRANLDGSSVEPLVTTGLFLPTDIVLDVAGGKMYWTNAGNPGNTGDRTVQRANLDGSDVEDLVSGSILFSPVSIDLDVAQGKMYWINADAPLPTIERANFDGSMVEVVVSFSSSSSPEGLALDLSGNLPRLRFVATTGNNTGNDCTDPANPCATLTHAVSQAKDGDIINLAAGTYHTPGILIDKELKIKGQGVIVQ